MQSMSRDITLAHPEVEHREHPDGFDPNLLR